MQEITTTTTATTAIAATTTTATATTTATTVTTSNTVVSMTSTKFKDVILETIDQLRQRKARPDLVRISHMLQRKHGISFHETEAILGKLVDSQVVFKVDYKGSTSYRNAAKWRINHLASSGGGGGSGTGALTQNSDQVSQKIREAVRALAGGGGNSSSLTSSNNSSNNNNNNNNNTSNSSSSSGSGGGSGGGVRRGRQQQQQNNDNKNSGAQTSSSVTAVSKKSGAASKSSAVPTNTFNHAGEKEPASLGSITTTTTTTTTTTKKGGSNVRADKASTHFRATSSEDKNNNSKSPTGSSVTPAAAAAATAAAAAVSLASSLTAASQASSTRRGGKKEQTGPVGVTLKDLEGWLNKQDSGNPLVKNLLVTALQREVQAGWLKRLRNGNYIDVASVANNSNTKKKSTNTKSNKNTGGAPTSSALASTQVTSPPSLISTSIVSPADDSTIAKSHPNTTTSNPNTNKNSIIIITDSANSGTNSTTIVTTPPSVSSFISQPVKPNITHGIKRSAPSGPFLDATQQLISQPTSAIIPTSDVTAHGTTLVLVPSSSPTTTPVHPTLLLPLSPTPTDPDRRTAPLTISSVSASSFPSSPSSSSLSPSSVSASFGSNHNNNALARVSLSSSLSTSSTSTGTPGLSREGAPARRDNNNVKAAKSAAIQPAGPTNAPVPAKRGRPASKRKRFKKTPGPEFETEDILKSEPEKCVSCSLTAQANKHGQPEELLICKDCNTTVHPSCMNYCEELAIRARNSPWQCIECKTCYVCDDSGDADSMLFCDACDKGYHMKCHVPHVEQKPKGKWVCGHCVSESGNSLEQPMEFETSNSEESRASSPSATGLCREPMEASGPSCLPTPCDSPVQPDPEEKETGREDDSISLPMLRDFQGPYPDAANWTIDDVVNFFKSAGFVSQAEAFREQEIDGKSLLLMKRSDVLTGLSLKLGPALKMYTHVQNLQLVGQSSFVNGTGH